MNKLILSLTIIATCIQVNAQHPKVCDYISLKHALKNREFEVITAVSTSNACVELLHTKKEIKIPTIGLFGKEIDYHNIINYKNDTIYIHRRVCRIWNNEELIEIKNSKGAYRIYEDEKTKISFEEFKIKENIEEECINSFPSIHLNLFEWEGIEKLFKDRGMAAGSEEYEELTRLVFENYKLLHADKWIFKPLGVPQKKLFDTYKQFGIKTNIPLEFNLVHVYDTISKRGNDEYITIMHEDENVLYDWFKKGSRVICLLDYENSVKKEKHYLHEEPDTRSKKTYKINEFDGLIIYDIVGLWYYVKIIDNKGKEHWGWIKLKKAPNVFYNTERYN